MTIHTIGDSHASKKHSGWKVCDNIIDHHIGPKLCYSIGRDGLDILNFKNYNIKENDTVILCFGEIDCRCHIHKYITETTSYKKIIDNIVSSYFKTIILNKNLYKNINICVYNVVPPIRKEGLKELKEFPYLGTNEERKMYTLYFNKMLKQYCDLHNFIFFDVYDKYCDTEGFLNSKYKDNSVHIKDGIFIKEYMDNNIKLH